MNTTNQLPNQNLENYAFGLIHYVIDAVDPAMQAQLIDFLLQLNKSSSTLEPVEKQSNEKPTQSWQTVLSQPANGHSVHNQWLRRLIRQRTRRHKQHVAHLKRLVRTTEHRFYQVQLTVLMEPHRSRLFNLYKQNLKTYREQLRLVQHIHESAIQRLTSMQNR